MFNEHFMQFPGNIQDKSKSDCRKGLKHKTLLKTCSIAAISFGCFLAFGIILVRKPYLSLFDSYP